MTVKGLTIESEDSNGRTYYEPVVATVTGFSKFNPDQFSLSGVDGFWSMSKFAKKGEKSPYERWGTPAKGTRAVWHLTTAPKTGEKAKPGSLYMDCIAIEKAPVEVPPDVDDDPLYATRPLDEGSYAEKEVARPKAPASLEGQEMSDAEAEHYSALHHEYAKWLALPEPKKPWDLAMYATIAAKAIERESIELQVAVKADAEFLAALTPFRFRSDMKVGGAMANTEERSLFEEVLARYNHNINRLSRYTPPEPQPLPFDDDTRTGTETQP